MLKQSSCRRLNGDLAPDVMIAVPAKEYYLNDVVFPAVLRHADAKLSANGQDLGGEVLCASRLGFSGTPNDLLPLALGCWS
eukprot:s13_g27.t1